MRVAQLQVTDAQSYRRLMLEGYAHDADAYTSTVEERAAQPLAWWEKRIEDSAGLTAAFGAFGGGTLIGSVALEFSAKAKIRHKAFLIGMYVSHRHRNIGAGRALLRAAIAHAAAHSGLRAIMLTVTEGNAAAIELYRSSGFSEFGNEPMAILTPSGYKAKVHMWLPLAAEARIADHAGAAVSSLNGGS